MHVADVLEGEGTLLRARMGRAFRGAARLPHTKWAWRRTAKCVICEIGMICGSAVAGATRRGLYRASGSAGYSLWTRTSSNRGERLPLRNESRVQKRSGLVTQNTPVSATRPTLPKWAGNGVRLGSR